MRLVPQPEAIIIKDGYCSVREITRKETVDYISSVEGYELEITENQVTARAGTDKGLYYAEVTFNQLISLYEKLPCMIIRDSPRYSHRGFMIDCARHIFSVSQLKKMIKIAASFKLNKFHWHLSDDQGFRIELDNFPELTRKGSVRKCDTFRNCEGDKEYGGYYTKEEIRDIVSFCSEHFIDVIPELDMPGHQSAFLHVYPQFTCSGNAVEVKTKQGIFKDIICAGNKEAEKCLQGILDEICDLFPYDTVHIGGDEVPKNSWRNCGKCRCVMLENGIENENDLQCFFINKMADYLKGKGKRCIVWNDCLKGKGLSDELIIQHWMGVNGNTPKAANEGSKIIVSPFNPFYVDYPYGMHTLENAYKYEPERLKGLDNKGRHNILGVESPLWTEFVLTDEKMEYMCFPRWFAVAEVGWTKKENKNYSEFLSVVRFLAAYYTAQGVNVAPEKDWEPDSLERLKRTVSFFIPK